MFFGLFVCRSDILFCHIYQQFNGVPQGRPLCPLLVVIRVSAPPHQGGRHHQPLLEFIFFPPPTVGDAV